jgi:hypothetical protein
MGFAYFLEKIICCSGLLMLGHLFTKDFDRSIMHLIAVDIA